MKFLHVWNFLCSTEHHVLPVRARRSPGCQGLLWSNQKGTSTNSPYYMSSSTCTCASILFLDMKGEQFRFLSKASSSACIVDPTPFPIQGLHFLSYISNFNPHEHTYEYSNMLLLFTTLKTHKNFKTKQTRKLSFDSSPPPATSPISLQNLHRVVSTCCLTLLFLSLESALYWNCYVKVTSNL